MSSHTPILGFFTGMPGWAELLIVAFVGLLLFGKRLPEVARSLGQSIIEFKKGMQGVKPDLDKADTPPPETDAERRHRLGLPDAQSSPSSSTTTSSTKQPVE